MRLKIPHIVLPILAAKVMCAAADVVADVAVVQRLATCGHLAVMDEATLAVCLVVVACVYASHKFVFLTCPVVELCACNVDLVRNVCRNEKMLVKGQLVIAVYVFSVFRVEPDGAEIHDLSDMLNVLSGGARFFSCYR